LFSRPKRTRFIKQLSCHLGNAGYYLSDGMGGNVGMLVDDGTASSNSRLPQFVVYDAFGNQMAQSSLGAGLRASFAWRGREGSAKDIGSNLVYMQSRHYDPTIGRFIQADSLRMASMTTQGMNRYVYASNDPVNISDPTGLFSLWNAVTAAAGITMITAGIALTFYGLPLLGFASMAFGIALLLDLKADLTSNCYERQSFRALARFFTLVGGLFLALQAGAALASIGKSSAAGYFAISEEGIPAGLTGAWSAISGAAKAFGTLSR